MKKREEGFTFKTGAKICFVKIVDGEDSPLFFEDQIVRVGWQYVYLLKNKRLAKNSASVLWFNSLNEAKEYVEDYEIRKAISRFGEKLFLLRFHVFRLTKEEKETIKKAMQDFPLPEAEELKKRGRL